MSFRNFNIAPRAAFCFALISLLVVALGFFSLSRLSDLYLAEQDIETNWMASIQASGEMQKDLLNIRLETLRVLASSEGTTPGVVDDTAIQGYRTSLQEVMAHYQRDLLSTGAESEVFQRVFGSAQRYLDMQKQVMDLLRQQQAAQALSLVNGSGREVGATLQQQLDALIAFNAAGAKQAGLNASETYSHGRTGVLVTIAVAVVLTVLLATLLTRSISVPLSLIHI